MFALALILAAAPTAPLELELHGLFHTELSAAEWSATCDSKPAGHCSLVAPTGTVAIAVSTDAAKSKSTRFELDLPEEGARVAVIDHRLARGELIGYSIANLVIGGALFGSGFAVHSRVPATILKVVGGLYGGLGAVGLCVGLASSAEPHLAARTSSGKPIPVRSVGLSGNF